ncbi:FAD:protein FMN transferase [candidate division KSB1 bacterium]|nr:FAD:protein FMN transferase [candidate division KSB1 bacterium]MBL7092609.1 FAD:protein FMN transferase [candidate division KSB1 bacterium]
MRKIPRFVVIILIFISCSSSQKFNPVEQTRILMDTFVQVQIFDQDKPEEELKRIIEATFQRIEEIDSITNNYNDSSLIAFINRNAGLKSVVLDSILEYIIQTSEKISEESNGLFDITIGSIKQLWNFSSDNHRIPKSDEIEKKLNDVNYQLIKLKNHKIKFLSPGIEIDLGAIAKGFAIDEAIRVLKKNNITDAMVNAGGDLRAICSELTRGKRKVWIRHPRIENRRFGYFQMDNGSVATSGDYERFFFQDSIRYHHILNPGTGYPANECVSVTVQTEEAIYADGLSTAIFVLGPKMGMELVKKLTGVEAVILFLRNGELDWIVSSGLKNSFTKP